MHPLLRAALACCPAGFRREYEAQIRLDAADRRWSGLRGVLFLSLNVAGSGLRMYGEAFARGIMLALRSLARARAYAIVSIVTLALAAGINLAVAAVVHGVLFGSLPYPDAANLYSVSQHGPYGAWSYANAHEVAARSRTFAEMGTAADDTSTLLGRGTPVRLNGKQVGEHYFPVLGLRPQLGRFIEARDMGKNAAVISDATWRAYFGGDPRAIGARIDLGGTLYTIVGIAPSQFRDPAFGGVDRAAYWIPDDIPARRVRFRGDSAAFARLRPGVSPAAATADLRRIVADLDRRYPNPAFPHPQPGTVVQLQALISGPVAPVLWLLYGTVDVLLLLACANVINLALVRAAARERDLVVRSALGANTASLAGQLCAESVVICVAGLAGAAGVAWGCLRLFASAGAHLLPRWDTVRLDGAVAVYAVLLLLAVALATGLLPLLWIRRDVSVALKSAGRGGTARRKTLRSALIVVETALAIAVVLCAALTFRSFVALTHTELGFDPSSVIAVENPPLHMASVQFETRVHDVQQLIAQMSAIPGVNAVAASHWIPLSNAYLSVPVNVPGTASTQYQAGFNPVTPAYFRALRIPLIAGRSFTQSDSLHARPVAIVSEQFARAHFGNAAAALGQTVRPQMDIGLNSTPARTIVGVVGDIRVSHGTPPQPSVYVPFSQFPLAFAFVIRSDARVAGIGPAVDRIFSRYDPQGAPPLLVPYTAVSATDTRDSGTAAMLFGVFAIVALALALAGIYAVTAYSVEQRTQEFGIRRAIGATKAAVVRTVLTATLVHALAGAAIGVTLAAFSARWFSALLYATSAFEPEALAAAIAIMLFCTMLAALVPALRAAHMQPNKALRYE